uniref:Hexosyltransferase n=1 Tax=Pristhesancus plagipennis TaxID=1955184 RepID=A0A2K8JUZ5_PRIPG|nr:secreted Galactosyl transferase-like protein [Pristhesancus plagipennis]
MFDKRYCRLVWALTVLSLGFLAIWQMSGCPGPPPIKERHHGLPLLTPNKYQPILLNNITSVSVPYRLNLLQSIDFSKLIDLEDFSFTTSVNICNSSYPLVITLIHSAPNHFEYRRRIRLTWGLPLDLVFLVGETNSTEEREKIDTEIREYGDIVQGTFVDAYRNLTYKHIMGLKWISYRCPGARYILKTDDDIFVNTPYLMEMLKHDLSPLGGRRLILCNVMEGVRAKRTYRSKWRVSPLEYPDRWYPNYCAGWVILYTPDVVFTLYNEAQRRPYFWIDDVHITGTLVALTNFTHTDISELSEIKSNEIDNVIANGGPVEFLFGLVNNEQFTKLWDLVLKTQTSLPSLITSNTFKTQT